MCMLIHGYLNVCGGIPVGKFSELLTFNVLAFSTGIP